ncbi:MAG: hypothetical protein R3C05_20075 [Pirellulaceae bacterium]
MTRPQVASRSKHSHRTRGRQVDPTGKKRLIDLDIDQSILSLVPESVARENNVLPIDFDGETITFAMRDPNDFARQDTLRFLLNCNVRVIARGANEIRDAIDHFYKLEDDDSVDSMLCEFTDTAIDFRPRGSLGAVSSMALQEPPNAYRAPRAMRKTKLSAVHSSSQRNGLMFYTISEGKRVLAHRPSGKIDVLEGPARVWRGFTRFESMQHFVAHPGQYLSVNFLDGREETLLGPTQLWFDPRIHQIISVEQCIELAAKEAVVVYGRKVLDEGKSPATTRTVFHGPSQFAPQPGEWLHQFSWHASHGGSRGEEKRPNALKFTKLCLMPDQMYHDVRDVRTADDAVLTIRLMIFFELVDIEKMLDTTHDPIGDFINAATSDVVDFTGKRSFEAFKQQTEQLNELDTYHQLLHRAQQCGYKINNVVYRGYGAPDSLQKMHDEAIQTRTRLQLEKATEQQAQEVEDYKLTCQLDRSARRRQEQMSEIEHDLEMKRRQSEAELQRQERQCAFLRSQQEADQRQAIELRLQSDQQKRTHFESLASLGVDLTQYLTQSRADQVIEVRGGENSHPHLHLTNGSTS